MLLARPTNLVGRSWAWRASCSLPGARWGWAQRSRSDPGPQAPCPRLTAGRLPRAPGRQGPSLPGLYRCPATLSPAPQVPHHSQRSPQAPTIYNALLAPAPPPFTTLSPAPPDLPPHPMLYPAPQAPHHSQRSPRPCTISRVPHSAPVYTRIFPVLREPIASSLGLSHRSEITPLAAALGLPTTTSACSPSRCETSSPWDSPLASPPGSAVRRSHPCSWFALVSARAQGWACARSDA